MSRDPFDEMRNRNPVTSDELPAAPMSVADRIVGRRVRSGMPAWAMAMAAAFLVAAVGGATMLFLSGGESNPVGSGDTTTTTEISTTSSTPGDIDLPASVYFLADNASEGWPNGPFLIPASRMIDSADTIGAAMQLLLAGPHQDESAAEPPLDTAIPEGTQLLGSSFGGGIATVNLSSEFVSGGGSFSMGARLAQVIATLTALDGVDGVRFEIEGVPTTVFGGEGVTVGDPATVDEVEPFLPAVMIESPAYGEDGGNPLIATGTANVFEATVSIELRDADDNVIFQGFTTATCGTGCRGTWSIEIPYQVAGGQYGTLRAFESSAEDGSAINVREHRVWLHAGDHAGTTTTTMPGDRCSGTRANSELVDQPELPDVVAETRAAIFQAALTCDWGTLQQLLGLGFSYSFGGGDDPIGYWASLEERGEDPMFFLAELLNRPFGTIEGEKDLTYFVWPSAFNQNGWGDVSDADREALRPLYDDDDFAFFEEFGGYVGYRIGILDDGSWVFFIAGD